MNNLLVTSGGVAVASAIFIQYLKKSNWFSFLSTEQGSANANRIFSALIAIVTSLGITFSYNAVQHQLIIDGLDPQNIISFGGHAFVQWIAQHVAYKTVVVPTELQGQLVAAIENLITHMDTNVHS